MTRSVDVETAQAKSSRPRGLPRHGRIVLVRPNLHGEPQGIKEDRRPNRMESMTPAAISDPIAPGSVPSGICQLEKGVNATNNQCPKHQAQGYPERDRLTDWPSAFGASYLMPNVRMRGRCVHSCLREPYREVAVANQQPRFSAHSYTMANSHSATSRPLRELAIV